MQSTSRVVIVSRQRQQHYESPAPLFHPIPADNYGRGGTNAADISRTATFTIDSPMFDHGRATHVH
jgi:hypothetical protein